MKIIEKLCQNFKRLYYYHLHEFINNYLYWNYENSYKIKNKRNFWYKAQIYDISFEDTY